MSDTTPLIQIISNAGFPVVVVLYLLVRVDKTIEESTNALSELTKKIIQLKELIKNFNGKGRGK